MEALKKRRVARMHDGIVCRLAHQHGDAAHPLSLLSLGHKRPRCHPIDSADELPSFHYPYPGWNGIMSA
jgi:hypothetical protein